MKALIQDLRYAWRSLRKRPGFAFVVIVTLALGIGVNSAIFSFISAFLLRPLPCREPDRLVRITSVRGNEEGRLSMLELKDLREQTSVFESVAPYMPGAQYNYSGDVFNVLGVPQLQGTTWPEYYGLERNFGIVLSYDLWKRRFGGDPNILGCKITLDAAPGQVLQLVIGEGMRVVSAGLVIGSATSFAVSRFVASQIYGVKASDPLTDVGVALLLIVVALLACFIPARRAVKVDPMTALRTE